LPRFAIRFHSRPCGAATEPPSGLSEWPQIRRNWAVQGRGLLGPL